MDVFAVAGGDGAGKTATALNLAVALREAGSYAAVLDADLSGNVASVLDVEADATLGDVLDGETRAREAVVDVALSADTLPESDLAAYRKALAADRTQFRAGADQEVETAEDEPDIDTLPVVAGFESRAEHTGTDPEALADVLENFVMAYDVLVVDTGNGPASQSPTIDVADGTITVATPDPAKMEAAREDVRACTSAGTKLMGTLVNRAGENTSISEVTATVGAEAFGVIPEDARTRALEPVFFSVPESPAASAYGRLADSTQSWDGTSAVTGATADGGGGGASEASRDNPSTWRGQPVDGPADDADDDEDDEDDDSGGFLSGLLGDD
jgi:MinD-like ATPase involved in chromosome partitioning or flagellar assembly